MGDDVSWLSDIEPSPVRWIWPKYLPRGKVAIFEGDPEQAKSLVTVDLTARWTTGRPMPTNEAIATDPVNVVLVTAEDDLADTVVPRLDAAGADRSRVGTVPLKRDSNGVIVPLTI